CYLICVTAVLSRHTTSRSGSPSRACFAAVNSSLGARSMKNGCCSSNGASSCRSSRIPRRRSVSRIRSRPASRYGIERRSSQSTAAKCAKSKRAKNCNERDFLASLRLAWKGTSAMTKQMQDAYIVAATRTPVGKAPRGAFKHTRPDSLLAHVLKSVLAQVPAIEPNRIDDVIVGCAMPEYEQGMNVARIGVLLAGLPSTVAGMTIYRFCSSGLNAVSIAADRTRTGEADIMIADRTESMKMIPLLGPLALNADGFARD